MKYKNISATEQSLIGIGVIPAGEVIETDQIIENPNFSEVSGATADAGAQTETRQPIKIGPKENDPEPLEEDESEKEDKEE